MIEEQKQRVEQEITKLVDDVDKSYLRKMQADMHLCAAKCCENTSSSIDVVQGCVQKCSVPVTKAERYIHKELNDFQGRLQRCVMQCNDDIKTQMPVEPTDDEIAKYTTKFERCAVQCVNKNLDLIPNLLKTMKSVLAKGPNRIPDV
ncbi:protein FAM136A [Phlebotomus argentipes]|uniref:protein FAM136A n=1 Tax=Phlebotomus argentipes TaxID=94469 RepID=UPI00289351BF|nr:protein FAM136A [Phlebotomus argentipes]